MKKEECKELVKGVFGQKSADDDIIVQWYFDVNQAAMGEYAKQKAIAFEIWKEGEGWVMSLSKRGKYYQAPVRKDNIDYKTLEQLFDLFNSKEEVQ